MVVELEAVLAVLDVQVGRALDPEPGREPLPGRLEEVEEEVGLFVTVDANIRTITVTVDSRVVIILAHHRHCNRPSDHCSNRLVGQGMLVECMTLLRWYKIDHKHKPYQHCHEKKDAQYPIRNLFSRVFTYSDELHPADSWACNGHIVRHGARMGGDTECGRNSCQDP